MKAAYFIQIEYSFPTAERFQALGFLYLHDNEEKKFYYKLTLVKHFEKAANHQLTQEKERNRHPGAASPGPYCCDVISALVVFIA